MAYSPILDAMQPRPAFRQETSSAPRHPKQMPDQRWRIAPPNPDLVNEIAEHTALSPLLAQVLVNRGIGSAAEAGQFLNPEQLQLPSPVDEFTDLADALELLMDAIAQRRKIAICGDYDADGMTSTALLLRSLRFLGADVDYAIPSRMSEGYGINRRIVEDFHRDGVQLILTVDNGIAAHHPIAYARELGLTVIVTDHHDVPPTLPPAHAILNPKLIDFDSPYSGVAGVGVAYILAVSLAQCLQQTKDLTTPLLELFTLGTIADLAPLTGVNRRWVRRGLKLLPRSRIPGVQALIQVAGLSNEDQALKPEAIGFRLGPRINAIGRIADPQIVIDLLTTDDPGRALELAMTCEQVNQHRQRLCEEIEQEAIAWCESTRPNLSNDRVLVVVQPNWHHGVIGIVASRLVERYGVPVFIGTYEDDARQKVRGSARGIPEFDVFKALQFAENILEKFGGHRAAGGFSLDSDKLDEFRFRLSLSANQQLMLHHLKPLVAVDVEAQFSDLSQDLWEQIDRLHPCGIENPDPVFWTANVRVLEQKAIGKSQAHLKLTVAQPEGMTADTTEQTFKAIAWRWGEYCPMPSPIDIAYRLKLNEWNGQQNVELEVIGVRPNASTESFRRESVPMAPLPSVPQPSATPTPSRSLPNSFAHPSLPLTPVPAAPSSQCPPHPIDAAFHHITPQRVEFTYADRLYACSISITATARELRIQNAQGQVLALQPDQRRGLLGRSRQDAVEIDISQPFYFNLVRAAMGALQAAEPVSWAIAQPGVADAPVADASHLDSSSLSNSSLSGSSLSDADAIASNESLSSPLSLSGELDNSERPSAGLGGDVNAAAAVNDAVSDAEIKIEDAAVNDAVSDAEVKIEDAAIDDAVELTSTVVAEPYDVQADELAIALVFEERTALEHSNPLGDRPAATEETLTESDAEPSITREPLEDPWRHEESQELEEPVDDFDEAALELDIEAALQAELPPLEPLVSPEQPVDLTSLEPEPAASNFFLSTQAADVDNAPADLSQIQGLMTGKQLHSRQEARSEASGSVASHESDDVAESAAEYDSEIKSDHYLEAEGQPPEASVVDESTQLSADSDVTLEPSEGAGESEKSEGEYCFDLSALPFSPAAPSPGVPTDAIAFLRRPLAELGDANGKFSPAQTRQWLSATLGELTWQQLQPKSQTDLGAAYRTYRAIVLEGDASVDYSKAGDRLSQAIQRELNQLFFKELRGFLSDRNQPTEINGQRLTARTKTTPDCLLPLLGREWTIFSASVLEQMTLNSDPFQEQDGIDGEPIAARDRQWVEEFLATWSHPLAVKLQPPSPVTTIAQIAQLCDRAAADLPFYQWQFEALHWLAFGTGEHPGLLSLLPGEASLDA